jgi:hypothetical protein
MYIPKYFKLQEFFPKDFFKKYHEKLGNVMWALIDNRILWTADVLRDRYGPMIVNDWLWRVDKHANNYRGFRPRDCKIGAMFSMHRFGRALDCKFRHVDVEEVRRDIKDNDSYTFKHITTIEINVTWLHFDCRNHDKKRHGVKLIKP